MNEYQPELGQFAFGCPHSQYECPDYIEAGLRYLECEIERVYWNQNQKEWESCFGNNGGEYKTKEFEVRSYYWGEDEYEQDLPNFKCGDFEVRWYKYLGRGMSMNKDIDANEFFLIMDKCLKSVRLQDKGID